MKHVLLFFRQRLSTVLFTEIFIDLLILFINVRVFSLRDKENR